MQVTETQTEGLKRTFRVVLEAGDLDSRVERRLEELKGTVRINGFRPGKVPVAHLRRLIGRRVRAEVIEQAVADANTQIISDNKLKLALEPKVEFPDDQATVQKVIEGSGDLAYTVAVEVLPEVEVADLSGVTLEKWVAPVEDAEVDAAIERLADQNRPYQPRPDGEAAREGDRVTLSFKGTIDGEAFEGGTADDIPVVLGSRSFLPGFEDKVVGIKAGETRIIDVAFPANYAAAHLAGKDAVFEVSCKEVAEPGAATIDDAFAKTLGLETLDALKQAVQARIGAEREAVTRARLKRSLLDVLDQRHTFELPAGLVEQEFHNVWRQVSTEMQTSGKTFADENTTEEAARADYRKIAERRVRLGLLLAEIGQKANIQVTDDEVTRALVEHARSYPGQEQQVWDYYRKNPDALASLRAPIYEEKVVDHLLSQAAVAEKTVTRDELFKQDDEAAPA